MRKQEQAFSGALLDGQVELEILELEQSELVKLARQAERLRCARRDYLYELKRLEREGAKLEEQGYTLDRIEELFSMDV